MAKCNQLTFLPFKGLNSFRLPPRRCRSYIVFKGSINQGLIGPRSPKGQMTYCPLRSTLLQNFNTIAQTVYEICVTKVFHILAPGGLTPGPKFTKRGEDLADSDVYHPAKFHHSTPTHARDIRYKNSCGQTEKKQ